MLTVYTLKKKLMSTSNYYLYIDSLKSADMSSPEEGPGHQKVGTF